MPELSNIQTYIETKDKDYAPTLERFKQVLINLNAWNEPTKRAFENPNWRDEGGFVYSEIMSLEPRTTKHSGVKVRPLCMVLTPQIDSSLTSNGLVCDLLVETDELIEDYASGKFRNYAFDFVELLSAEMIRNLGTAVYFTNEADDGEPFDGYRTNNLNKLWKFDYALIPIQQSDSYSTPPNSHQIRTNGQYLECWKTELWRTRNTDNRR